MARLELDSVTKRFGEGDNAVLAVNGVDINIRDGEFLVLVGPSGCGKSTTLRMIAGLESATAGEIRLGDERINEQRPAERNIAMVFQSYALYPHMTVRGNMRFGLEESTDLADEIAERVTETAELLDIDELLDRKPEALSGGQQQRVALGRAIVREPEAFLMDEPLSNLDAKLRSQMRTELQQLQDDLDTTTVYVTHDQTEAMTMGDRIAILNDGILQQVATPLEAYHRPANQFVAGFIGEPPMNFVNCAVEGDTLTDGLFRYRLADETATAVASSTMVTLGIRPEDIVVDASGDALSAAGDHVFPATINVVEPVGNESVVYLSVTDGPDLVATVSGFGRVESGIDVAIRLPENAIHVFDAESGDAVHNRSLDESELVETRV